MIGMILDELQITLDYFPDFMESRERGNEERWAVYDEAQGGFDFCDPDFRRAMNVIQTLIEREITKNPDRQHGSEMESIKEA